VEVVGEPDRLLDVPGVAVVEPVGRGDADEHGLAVRPLVADGLGDLADEPAAVLEAAAVLVVPVVRDRGEELVEEVAVGRVHLRDLEAGLAGAPGALPERINHVLDAILREFPGRPRVVLERVRVGARRDRVPAAVVLGEWAALVLPGSRGPGFPAGVCELDAGGRALLAHELGDRLEGVAVVVAPDAEVLGRDAAPFLDGGRLRDDDAGAADRPRPQVDAVPVGREAVAGLAGVLAHRRHREAIPYRRLPQFQRREGVWHRRQLPTAGV